ncbi:Glycosyl transferase, family 14 [Dillenia turbinata]|uniref:Glycosyl transferase, family 14 n=1 Tax=Dillenia turbinata TaxID=194707 RepID=A0AAN8Z8R5_9MAGN
MFSTPFVLSFSLLFSLPLLFFFAPQILPPRQVPITLPDEIEDLSLFRRAVFSTISSQPSFSSSLYRLDPSIKLSSPGGVFEGRSIAAKRTQRASATLISAARRLLANAILDDPSNEFFALVSQYCIPLHSFKFLYKSLFSTKNRVKNEHRYRSFIEILSKDPTLWKRYNARGKNVMLPEVSFDSFRVGSQFFVLTKKHALIVIKDRKLWKKFKLPCIKVDSCYPEEHYFPTLLSAEDPEGCSNYTLTRVNWTDSVNGHPHLYKPPEVSPKLIFELRQSNTSFDHMFARKFSPDCLNPLMEIADSVIFKD